MVFVSGDKKVCAGIDGGCKNRPVPCRQIDTRQQGIVGYIRNDHGWFQQNFPALRLGLIFCNFAVSPAA